MDKDTLPHTFSLGILPLQSQGLRGGALGAEARQSLTQATSTELQAIRQRTGALLTHRGSHRQDVSRSQGGHSYDLFKHSLQSIYFYTEVKMCTDNG